MRTFFSLVLVSIVGLALATGCGGNHDLGKLSDRYQDLRSELGVSIATLRKDLADQKVNETILALRADPSAAALVQRLTAAMAQHEANLAALEALWRDMPARWRALKQEKPALEAGLTGARAQIAAAMSAVQGTRNALAGHMADAGKALEAWKAKLAAPPPPPPAPAADAGVP